MKEVIILPIVLSPRCFDEVNKDTNTFPHETEKPKKSLPDVHEELRHITPWDAQHLSMGEWREKCLKGINNMLIPEEKRKKFREDVQKIIDKHKLRLI